MDTILSLIIIQGMLTSLIGLNWLGNETQVFMIMVRLIDIFKLFLL